MHSVTHFREVFYLYTLRPLSLVIRYQLPCCQITSCEHLIAAMSSADRVCVSHGAPATVVEKHCATRRLSHRRLVCKKNCLNFSSCTNSARILSVFDAFSSITCLFDGGFFGGVWASKFWSVWQYETIAEAAFRGDVDLIEWATANGCKSDHTACMMAARGGHLKTLQWLRVRCFPWSCFYSTTYKWISFIYDQMIC